MDKNEQNVMMDELKKAMHNRDFAKAVDIADSLEIKKIKDNNFLSLVADAYEVSHRYDDAKRILIMAYENTNAGRHLAYRLCLIALKTKEYDEAEEFYEDFVEMAPRDTTRYVLQYKMAKAKGQPIEKLIDILEEYVNLDMEEKWAYELAKLYHLAEDSEKCVDMCDEISLWFAEGKYVMKAMDLKRMYRPLTASQQKKYDEEKNGKANNIYEESNEENKASESADDLSETKIIVNPINTPDENSESDNKTEEVDNGATRIIPSLDQMKAFQVEPTKPAVSDLDMQEIEMPSIEIDLGDVGGTTEEINTDHIAEIMAEENKEEAEPKQVTKAIPKVEENNQETAEEIGATKAIPNLDGLFSAVTENDSVEIVEPVETKDAAENIPEVSEEVKEEPEETVETVEAVDIDEMPVSEENEDIPEPEPVKPISDMKDVQDILRQLQERGILKAETVDQAVTIMDEAEKAKEEGLVIDDTAAIPVVVPEETVEQKTEVPEELEEEVEEIEVVEASGPMEEIAPTEDKVDETALRVENIEQRVESIEQRVENIEQLAANKASGEDAEEDSEEDSSDEELASEDTVNEDTVEETIEEPIEETIEEPIEETIEEPIEETIEEPIEETTEEPVVVPEIKKPEIAYKVVATTELSAKIQIISGAESNGETEIMKEEIPVVKEEAPVLSEEELSAFKNYLNVEGFEDTIKEILTDMISNFKPTGKSDDGNLIILGDKQTGKTKLAIEVIKLVNKKRGRRNRRLVKVDAQVLNKRGFRNSLSKLLGNDLIVENAHNLGTMTVSELIDGAGMFTDDMIIILEADVNEFENVIEISPRIKEVFTHCVTIREYDIKEWAKYAKEYANEQGYSIDELANLALFKAIDDYFGEHKSIGEKDVEKIIDDAIDKSSRLGRKLSGLFGGKKDDQGMLVLKESDFNLN